jgi:hypothetical protein
MRMERHELACLSPFDFPDVLVVDGVHHPNDRLIVQSRCFRLRFEVRDITAHS